MPKSHDVSEFLRMHALVLKDISARLPEIRSELEKDYVRLRSISMNRGVALFTLDLPALGKEFLRALSSGSLSRMGIPLSRCDHDSVIPRLYKGLWKKVFTDDGCLRSNIDPFVIKSMQMLFFMFKKFEMDAPDKALYETTQEFVDVDSTLPKPSLDWLNGLGPSGTDVSVRDCQGPDTGTLSESVPSSGVGVDSGLLDTIQRVADVVSTSIGIIEPGLGRHGPGAVSENVYGIRKFGVRHWSKRLWQRFNPAGFFVPVGDVGIFDEEERASVLIAVPKTQKGPRLIAKEPTANLYCQMAVAEQLDQWIRSGPLRNSIDLRDQSVSGRLALSSSDDRRFGTIDLKSASDRLSLWLVERIFRRNRDLLEIFQSVRTAFCDVSIDKKLTPIVELRKFATQGTALTFPVQSIVFTTICIAAVAHARKITRIDSRVVARLGKEVRVYGDDIIVPTDMVETVVIALEALYLKVNKDKTHYKGSFRESCGVDAYAGVDVTPTYCSLLPSMRPAPVNRLVEMSNNAYLSGWPSLADYIRLSVPNYELIPIVPDTGSGFVAFVRDGYLPPKTAKFRWNPHLQRVEALLLKVVTKPLRQKVGSSLALASFLAISEKRSVRLEEDESRAERVLPWLLEPWRPLSRVEISASEAEKWVPFPYESRVAVVD